MKVVINKDFGGFGLSEEGFELYLKYKEIEFEVERKQGLFGTFYYKKGHLKDENFYLSEYDIDRADPALIQVVEELGDRANSNYSSLKVVEIPDDIEWTVEEYDGMEHIAEKHRTWS